MPPQPRLEPPVMSLRPNCPWPYSQGLSQPSGGSPSESKKSLSNAIMPATVCILAISWMLGDGRRRVRQGVVRRTGVAQLVPLKKTGLLLTATKNLCAWAEMSGIPRPVALHKPNHNIALGEKRSGQVSANTNLYKPLFLVPRLFMKAGTETFW